MKKMFVLFFLFGISADICGEVGSLESLANAKLAELSFGYVSKNRSMLPLNEAKVKNERYFNKAFDRTRLPAHLWLDFALKTTFWGIRGKEINEMVPEYSVIKIIDELEGNEYISKEPGASICFRSLRSAAKKSGWIRRFLFLLSNNYENDRNECFKFLRRHGIDLQVAYDFYFNMNPGRRAKRKRAF